MPIAPAAVSSSRIAIQARPRRESRSRMQQTIVSIRTPSAVQKKSLSASNDCEYAAGRPRELLRPLPKPGESIGLIPKVPCVRSNPFRLSALRTNCGMISPKPSVTIAR
jgi:hypothetical protein